MKTHSLLTSSGVRSARCIKCGMAVLAASATLLAAAGAASAKPVISHDPVHTAVKGEPLGLRATVRDAGGRISSVSVFYASSRGMTPFRRDLSTTGAGIWFGTIPGHLIGPGSNLFYYVHADNIEGDSTDTEWVTVNVIEPGMSAADMPSVQAVARESQLAAAASATAAAEAPAPAPAPSKPASKPAPKSTPKTASRTVAPSEPASSASAPVMVTAPASAKPAAQGGEEASPGRNKYLVPAAIVLGGAAVIGGAIAIANSGGGGGGSGNDSGGGSGGSGGDSSSTGTVTNGTYGGTYNLMFEPSSTESNAVTRYESGIVSLYVENSTVSIVGIWDTEISASLAGNIFTAESTLPARGDFPDAHLIIAGNIGSSTASARIVGSSTDTANPGNFTGNIDATRH